MERLFRDRYFWFIVALAVVLGIIIYGDDIAFPSWLPAHTEWHLTYMIFGHLVFLAGVVIAAWRFGTKGGLVVTVALGLIVVPHSITMAVDLGMADELLETGIVIATGVAFSWLIGTRKRAEGTLRKSEEKYRSLFEKMLDGFAYCKILVDENNKPIDFVYLEVNGAFERLTGLRREDVIGKKVTEAIPGTKESHPELFSIYGKVALTGESTSFDLYFKPLGIWLTISVYSPQKGYFVAVFDNITERKRAETALKEAHNQLEIRVRERRSLLGRIITAQEEERRRIARELHDEVSQTLTGLVMSLGSTESLSGLEPAARQRLESLRNLTSEAVEEVRRLIRDLRPSLLDDLGLVAAISWYVENYLATAGVKAELDTHGFDRRLPPTVEITLFRVVQEAITNIVKHAQAKTARVYLKRSGSTIVGSIEDSGVGFDADTLRREQSGGVAVGLLGMEERINLLEGKLKIESRPGGGTRVYFEIPWQESDGEENSHSYS